MLDPVLIIAALEAQYLVCWFRGFAGKYTDDEQKTLRLSALVENDARLWGCKRRKRTNERTRVTLPRQPIKQSHFLVTSTSLGLLA